MRILVVDNNKDIAEIIQEIVASNLAGQIEVVHSGRGALAKITKRKYDLLILDVMMPDLNGVEVCQQIVGNDQLPEVPVILISALPLSSVINSQEEMKRLGIIKGVLEKPFDYDELLYKIREVVGGKEEKATS
ncbi:MAG: response regulator [Parcubacteria group bacterium]|nr:response regulator [Parcubacteria group bacterium]